MGQNKFSIKFRATAEGGLEYETDPPTKPPTKGTTSAAVADERGLEYETDPPTKPPKGTRSAAVATEATVSDPKFTIEGTIPGSSSSQSNRPPRTLILIPSIGVEFELDDGWERMTVNCYTDTPVTRQVEPPAEPPHN